MEALNRLLEDLKLFSDAEAPSKSPVDAIESVEKVLVSEQLNFPAKTVSASKKRNDPKPKSVQFQKASPPLPRLDLQSQSCVDQFALNLAQSPKLIRQFFALQTSGLSSDEQGKIIHYGFKLESKILELMEQYNNYVKDLGNICLMMKMEWSKIRNNCFL